MNRETRDKFATRTQADLTEGNACWETAPAVFAKMNEDFGPFDIDLTADRQRHLCRLWFGPDSPVDEREDALVADWHVWGKNGYSNPPYGPFVQRILAKAKAQAALGFTSKLLIPLRVTKAFRAHILNGASDLIFPDQRLVFFENGVPRVNLKDFLEKGTLRADPAMFDSIIVGYQPGKWDRPRLSEWKVPVHVFPADLERWRERRLAA